MYYNVSQNHSHSYKYTTTASSSDVQPQNNFSKKSASSFLLPSTFLSTIAIFLYALGTIISLAVIFCCFWCKYRLCDNSVEQVHGEDHQIGEETNNDNDDDDQIELITETDDEPPNYDWAMIYSSKACRDVLEASSPSPPPPYFEAVDSVSPQPSQHYYQKS